MQSWKFWRLLILCVVLGGLAWTIYQRGIPGQLGGRPASLETSYKTEREWINRQIALDIDEMAAFADRRVANQTADAVAATPWDPDSFLPNVYTAFGDAAKAAANADAVAFYPALTALDVPSLTDASAEVSRLLAANMRDPRAHESAALVVGAFALREAADWLTDVRWALNRMTAHLAIATALRPDQAPGPDGALANIILLSLSNRHARALTELERLGSGAAPEPLAAWVRAMRMRITRDWRVLPQPAAATRIEKLEYFRARRLATQRRRAAEQLGDVAESNAADFARIAQDSPLGVEDGHEFIQPALEWELGEAHAAYQRIHSRPMPRPLPAALNHRASRLINGDAPQVLPWGAWAEFFQRHIAMNVGMVDSFERHMLGAHDAANASKEDLNGRLGGLTLFPLGTLRRTKGSRGTEADLAYIKEIIELTAAAPELVPVRAWKFAETGSHFEPVNPKMPQMTSWFAAATPAIPFEAGIRYGEGMRATEEIESLLTGSPHDTKLLIAIAKGDARDPAVTHARGLLAHHHDYDLATLDASLAFTEDAGERAALQRRGCSISSRDCLNLAGTLLYSGDEKGAAAMYESALADPNMDDVARARDSDWLVTYYHANGQIDKAIALAERAARTGANAGLNTRARLFERLGKLDAAEKDHLASAERYNSPEGLLAFYYRRVEVDMNRAYQSKWDTWRPVVFPNGLQPAPTSMPGVPPTGVFVYKDSAYLRDAGLRAGDIIVGVDGWRVDTEEQYWTIIDIKDDPTVRFTLSRGGQLVTVEATSPTRLFGGELQTHPMKGWIKN